MSAGERIVVVGTGGAGLRAAERVRELDFTGELVIIGEEPYRPYHRPMLSKQVLTGCVRPRDVLLPTHSDLGAMWRPKTRASRLDTEEHIVYLPGGEEIDYDGLIIATGMQASHLPGAPRHDPRIHVLRTVADAIAVQKLLAKGKGRVALIGGGFLAGEVASAAREMGRDTTIIIRESAMLEHVPGYDVSETVTALHEANGVRLVTDATVNHWHTDSADGITMHLSTGEVVVADCVLLCVGGVPATDWLRGSGLYVDDGVLCGATTHALGADDVVVAGDVARWPNLRFDTVPRRVEHWMNAVEMGRAAADALLVGRDAAQPYTPLPKFWSEQHGVRIQGAGIPSLAQDTVPLTESVPIGSKITGYVAGGSLVGILAWDSPRGTLHYNRELDRQTTEAMRRRMAETGEPVAAPSTAADAPGPEFAETPPAPRAARPPARPLPPARPQQTLQPMPQGAVPADLTRQRPVRPPMPRPGMAQQSIPSMPPAMQSSPGMPPAMQSSPGMPPATQSHPGFPAAGQSHPGFPPAGQSHPGFPPAGQSHPGFPPAGQSHPGFPPAGQSHPGFPPATQSSPGMPSAMQSSPGMPPARPPHPATQSHSGMPPARPQHPATQSNPGMPPARPPHPATQSNPGMPPARPPHPATQSNPGMPPATQSHPGFPPAGQSHPGFPPATQSSPGMPPAMQSNPGMPPATRSSPGMPPATQSSPGMPPVQPGGPGYAPMYAPLHASMTGPLPGPIPDAVPVPIYDPQGVEPARYNPPLSGSADTADPAIMELPPIDAWRKAS